MAQGNARQADDRQAWNAREIARRNRSGSGRPLSPVMKTAATACELAHAPAALRKRSGQTNKQANNGQRNQNEVWSMVSKAR